MAKSPGTGAVLGFLFGPFGLLYVGGGHFFAALVASIIFGAMTGGGGFFLAWFGCAFWGYLAAGNQSQAEKQTAALAQKRQLHEAKIQAAKREEARIEAAKLDEARQEAARAEAAQWEETQQREARDLAVKREAAARLAARLDEDARRAAAKRAELTAPLAPPAPTLITSQEEAQQLAQSIVAEVELYARDHLSQASREGQDPTTAVREELQEAKTRLAARLSPELGTGVLHFQRAVRDLIISKYGAPGTARSTAPGAQARITSGGATAPGGADRPALSSEDLPVGTQLDGRYEVVRQLGQGAMATVYVARHLALHSMHALKVLKSDLARDADLRGRFIAEGRIQAQIRHPNIVAVTEIVTVPVPGLVMEYVEGASLGQHLAQVGRALSVQELTDIMLPVLDAVEAAHSRGVIHRDLKPENILIGWDTNGRVHPKVSDFGIAKLLADGDVHATMRKTSAGARMGTLLYMSPEQIRGAALVDVRSDVFSLGAILYELATGRCAFDRGSDFDTMTAIVSGAFEPPERVVKGLPTGVANCIRKALQSDPAARFPSCLAFRTALAEG